MKICQKIYINPGIDFLFVCYLSLNSHLVVKRPNDIPKTLTKWGLFSFAPTLQKNDELAHLLHYFELFPDTIANYKRQLTQLPPWH
jgi:hypothetical protein